jgi:hypothetical protein
MLCDIYLNIIMMHGPMKVKLQNIVYMKYFRDCDPAAITYYILASFCIYRTNIGNVCTVRNAKFNF